MRARALLLSIGLSILIPGSLGWWSTSTTTRRTSSVTSSGTSSLPSPTPTIDCSYGVIADALSDPSTRWSEANTASYWANVSSYLSQRNINNSQIFVGDVLIMFNYTATAWDCANLAPAEPCSGTIQCSDVNHPAGYLIINSFVSIHNFYENLWAAIDSARANILGVIGNFATIFSPQAPPDPVQSFQGMAILLELMIGLATAGAFGAAFESIDILVDGLNGAMNGAIDGIINLSFETASGQSSSLSNALNTQNTVSGCLTTLVQAWQTQVSNTAETIFSGTPAGVTALTNLMYDGMMLPAFPTNFDGLTTEMEKILYGLLMPQAWAASPASLLPFILKTPFLCNSTFVPDTPNLYPLYQGGMIPQPNFQKIYVCIDDEALFILNAVKPTHPGSPLGGGRGDVADEPSFQELPGANFDNLNGANWGGVLVDDIVISSYQGYLLNGKKNGYQMPQDQMAIDGSGTLGNIILQNGIRTPGVFTIMVCDYVNLQDIINKLNWDYDTIC